MAENQDNLIKELERKVASLMEWKEEKENQQLQFPLDKRSIGVLDNAFREAEFARINVTDIYFKPNLNNPTNKGQMRFHDDLTTQTLRMMTSTIPPDAADVTVKFDVTAL